MTSTTSNLIDTSTLTSFASSQEWEDMLVVSQQGGGSSAATDNGNVATTDLLSNSSHHSEAAQVFHSWQSEQQHDDVVGCDIVDDAVDTLNFTFGGGMIGDMMDSEMDDDDDGAVGIVSDDDDYSSDDADDDIIMQLDDDEGLLPNNLDDFYDSLAKEVLLSSGSSVGSLGNSNGINDIDMLLMLHEVEDGPDGLMSNTSMSTASMSPAIIGGDSFFANHQHHYSQTNMDEQRARFDATVRKLAESMRKSQASRRSLYARSTGLDNYKRMASVQQVLQSIEYSTRHVDSYCRRVARVSAS